MSKRTDFLDADGSPMTIEGRADHKNWAIKFASTYREFTPEDAPTLALAILEAAGHKGASSSYCLMQAFDLIDQHIKEEAAKDKEAADREALEADAVRLHDAWRSELRNMTTTAWGELGANHRAAWIGVARAARAVREMTEVKA